MREVKYRTETLYGSGFRDAINVLTYECYELDNTDILSTLLDTILKDCGQISDKLNHCINNDELVDSMTEENWREVFRDVLDTIEKNTGYRIRYALWLADKDVVLDKDIYGSYITNESDLDAYEIGPVVLSDLGRDGILYGYEEWPNPIKKLEREM